MSIGLLEGYAFLWGLRVAIPRTASSSTTLRVRVDNRGLMYQARKLSARDPNIQPVLREIMLLCGAYGVRLEIHFVPSKLNVFSDYLTREHCDGAATRAGKLAELKANAIMIAAGAKAKGQHRVRAALRPQLLPMLEAERVSALRFNSKPQYQDRAELDSMLRNWDPEAQPRRRAH